MLRKTLLFFLLLLAMPAFAIGPCKGIRSDDLVIAQSGGFWEKGKTTGYFRALVYRLGWEHTRDVVQIEVMFRDERRKQVRILRCQQIEYKTTAPVITKKINISELTKTTGQVQLVAHTGRYPGKTSSFTYTVDINGKVTENKL